MNHEQTQAEQKVTRSEIFAGAAFILSASSLIFTGGVIYGDVQRNSKDIIEIKRVVEIDMKDIKSKLDPALLDIAGMKSDVKFLVRAEERRQGIKDRSDK